MNSEEEQEYKEYDSAFKCRYVVISNNNDILFFHNNVNILKDKEVEKLVKSMRKEITQEGTPFIFDVTKTTKDLTINQIKDIIIKTLLPDFDASENDSSAFNEADYENNMNEENKNATIRIVLDKTIDKRMKSYQRIKYYS